MFFFMALMGVTSEKSEAIKVINTSNTTLGVTCLVEYYNNNEEKTGEAKVEFLLQPNETSNTPTNPFFNIVRITLDIYRVINNEWQLVGKQQSYTAHENVEIMDIAFAALNNPQ